MNKTCRKCGLDKALDQFGKNASQADGRARTCKSCDAEWALAHRGATKTPRVAKTLSATDFIPSKELTATWVAVQMIAQSGQPAPNMLFTGPSGSGKTRAAQHLAEVAGLDFIKVDAPSMTDPEAWFGTREVIVEDGASKTIFRESEFAKALTRPCVLLIDEVNRIADHVRGILLPAFDDSRAVTNPLTGETIVRHPACFVVMTGNVGLQFTGTYAIDPAFLTRALSTRFDYLEAVDETALAIARTGCSPEHAALFVRFAAETRQRAKQSDEFPPVSTREVLVACALVSKGLDETTAIRQVVINASSADGGAESIQANLEMIWAGIRPAK